MNRTFKIVFNKARGMLMVANEATSSVQKKGTKTVVTALAAIAATAFGTASATTYEGKELTIDSNYPLDFALIQPTEQNVSSTDDIVRNNTLVLKNTSGGPTAIGISVSGVDATVENAKFENNSVTDSEGSLNGVYGAAIGVQSGKLSVSGETFFTGNKATGYRQVEGSAIYQSNGTISISGSTTFQNNQALAAEGQQDVAVMGGAVSLWGTSGSISGATFSSNSATATKVAYGGGLYLRSGIWGGADKIDFTITDSKFEGNSAVGTRALGGGLYVKSDNSQDKNYVINLTLANVDFENNSANHMGGGMFITGNGTLTMSDVTFEGNTAAYGSALMVYANKDNESFLNAAAPAVITATNVDYLNNIASSGATLYLYTKSEYTQTGGSFVGNKTIDTSDYVKQNPAFGAVFVKGAEAVFENVLFSNNVVKSENNVAAGGAVYVDKVINSTVQGGSVNGSVTFRVSKDMTYSGNNVEGISGTADTYGYLTTTAGGFLFLDRGTSATFDIQGDTTLTIGETDATGNMDSIASAWASDANQETALITKTGTGTLVINSDLNKYYGKVTVENGRMEVAKSWTINDAVTVNGGTLATNSFTFNKLPDPSTVVGSVTVGENGTLETLSNQVFTQAASDTADSAGELRYGTDKIVINGTLALADETYTLAYAQSAGDLITTGKVAMLGNLVGSVDNTVTIEDIESVGENVELSTVTVDTTNRNLQIGGTNPNNGTAYRENGLSVGALELGAGNAVTVIGESLNLAGTGGDLIATGEDQQTVTVTLTDGATLGLGGVAAQGGVLNGTVDIDSTSTMAVNGNADFTVDAIKGNGSVNVGDASSAGKLTINSIKDFTGMIFVDPAWVDGHAQVGDASHVSIGIDSSIGAQIVAGQNSLVALGAASSTAVSAFEKIAAVNNLTWKDDVTAVVYVDAPITLSDTGSIMIDGSLTLAPDQGGTSGAVKVTKQGMLIANQAAAASDTALIGGTVTFDKGSYLGLVNSAEGTFKLADSITDSGVSVVTDNPFIVLDQINASNGTVSTRTDVDSGLQSIASLGLQAMTRRADSVMAGAIADRTSIGQKLKAGLNLWVDVAGETYEADHFDKGGSFKADMGYGTFGGDVAVGNFSFGGAFQYGTGTLRSSVNSIKNSIDNYGVSLYGTYQVTDAVKLAADLAYVWGENDITANQSALNQSVDTEMYSLGVRAMYQAKVGVFSFEPSIGLRISQLSTDEMKVGTIKIDDQDQTLVQMPIALRITASDFTAGGWVLAPSFKIAYVPTFGEKDIEVLNVAEDVIDTSPVQTEFGLHAGKDNMLFNVNFMIGAGEYGSSAVGGKVGFKYAF